MPTRGATPPLIEDNSANHVNMLYRIEAGNPGHHLLSFATALKAPIGLPRRVNAASMPPQRCPPAALSPSDPQEPDRPWPSQRPRVWRPLSRLRVEATSDAGITSMSSPVPPYPGRALAV